MDNSKYCRAQEVADYTHLSICTIRAYVLQKKIPYIKKNGVVLFNLAEIDAWLNQSSVPVLDRHNSPSAEA